MSATTNTAHGAAGPLQPLQGGMLWLAAVVLATANFIAVLDMTIANVSVASIAGNLGISSTQGTWVITSYAVAEAIIVPLTGWLAARFGPEVTYECQYVDRIPQEPSGKYRFCISRVENPFTQPRESACP